MIQIKILGLGYDNVINAIVHINNNERMINIDLNKLSMARSIELTKILNEHMADMWVDEMLTMVKGQD